MMCDFDMMMNEAEVVENISKFEIDNNSIGTSLLAKFGWIVFCCNQSLS